MKKIAKEQALDALEHLMKDFQMLECGDWVPDEDSCGASIDNVRIVQVYVKATKELAGKEVK